MTTKNFTWQEGFLTPNDKKALVDSLNKKKLGSKEKRTVLHGKTYLTLESTTKNGYKVGKAVDGGSSYQYSSYFYPKK
jgi:hypothetical protein